MNNKLKSAILSLQEQGEMPTPFYIYDRGLIDEAVKSLKKASAENFPDRKVKMHYAMKANNEPEIMKMMLAGGLGIDAVSIEEVEHAVSLGFAPASVTFAGVGKTVDEINLAANLGVGQIVAESLEELADIDAVGRSLGKAIPVALRINPNIDAHTHKFITTGLNENKFGLPKEMIPEAFAFLRGAEGIDFAGLHFHVGSQIMDYGVFTMLAEEASEVFNEILKAGFNLRTLSLGGGLGVDYARPDANPVADFRAWMRHTAAGLKLPPEVELHFEPGRSLMAQAGNLVSRVARVKKGASKRFVIVDAGFTALIRPAFYQAYHKIENITAQDSDIARNSVYDVVGPLCESSDVFAENVSLPETHRDDLLVFRSAGAYGSSMASAYNLRRLYPSKFF